ncbi:MAG: hypothetical protein ABSG01_15645 [Anaerolineales bacterium]
MPFGYNVSRPYKSKGYLVSTTRPWGMLRDVVDKAQFDLMSQGAH